ncbi:hypothetical protein AMECASPLE_009180 [Ameca splendens]|uniref:Uncharacterized protein n=1 Tax=Ameca splendens TaxID=208324 RepID=A0ABV1A9N4_9TELE
MYTVGGRKRIRDLGKKSSDKRQKTAVCILNSAIFTLMFLNKTQCNLSIKKSCSGKISEVYWRTSVNKQHHGDQRTQQIGQVGGGGEFIAGLGYKAMSHT